MVSSVRRLCVIILLCSLFGYLLSYIAPIAVIDATIGTIILSLKNKRWNYFVIAGLFGISAITNIYMLNAVIEQQANFAYNYYEMIISITSLMQAAFIFGDICGEYIRNTYCRICFAKYNVLDLAVNKIQKGGK